MSRQLQKISHILFEEKNEYSKTFIVKSYDIKKNSTMYESSICCKANLIISFIYQRSQTTNRHAALGEHGHARLQREGGVGRDILRARRHLVAALTCDSAALSLGSAARRGHCGRSLSRAAAACPARPRAWHCAPGSAPSIRSSLAASRPSPCKTAFWIRTARRSSRQMRASGEARPSR